MASYNTTLLGQYAIVATSPIIATVTQWYTDMVSWADRTILSPAKNTSYNRYSGYNMNASYNGATITVGTYVIYDLTSPVASLTIADGGGLDCCQGLAYEYLCDRYSWGNTLSDYVILAVYPNTVIHTYYWSGTSWVIWDSHSLSGTMYNPTYVLRDGTAGSGVSGSIISGGAVNMSSGATLWKWEGNNPFYLGINDAADDEISMLGWNSVRPNRSISDTNSAIYDISKPANTITPTNIKYLSNTSLLTIDDIFDYINIKY